MRITLRGSLESAFESLRGKDSAIGGGRKVKAKGKNKKKKNSRRSIRDISRRQLSEPVVFRKRFGDAIIQASVRVSSLPLKWQLHDLNLVGLQELTRNGTA